MNSELVLKELELCGALLNGHFLLSSGLHSARYVQCALLFADPKRAESLGQALAAKAPAGVELVVSPALGGLVIGHEAARALGVRHFFTERVDGKMALRRGFAIHPGEKVLVVEDVFTTGKSTQEVVEVIKGLGADVVGALSVVRRTEGPLAVTVPHDSLLLLQIESYGPKECPLCKQGGAAIKPGSRPQPSVKNGKN